MVPPTFKDGNAYSEESNTDPVKVVGNEKKVGREGMANGRNMLGSVSVSFSLLIWLPS